MTLLKFSVKNRHATCADMENKYKKPKIYRCIVHVLGLSLFYASKIWNNSFARKFIIPLCLIFIAYGIMYLYCWHFNYVGIPSDVAVSVNLPRSTKVLEYCDGVDFYGIYNNDPIHRWIPSELISLSFAGMAVVLFVRIMFVKVR
jgi:hypothetical protein